MRVWRLVQWVRRSAFGRWIDAALIDTLTINRPKLLSHSRGDGSACVNNQSVRARATRFILSVENGRH